MDMSEKVVSELILPIDEISCICNNIDEIEFVCQSNEMKKGNTTTTRFLMKGRMHASYTFTQSTRTEYCKFCSRIS